MCGWDKKAGMKSPKVPAKDRSRGTKPCSEKKQESLISFNWNMKSRRALVLKGGYRIRRMRAERDTLEETSDILEEQLEMERKSCAAKCHGTRKSC